MTKRKYLKSIGYQMIVTNSKNSTTWFKYYCFEKYKFRYEQQINFNSPNKYAVLYGAIRTQKDIDNLQIAFNNVKRDYEEMQKYED